MARRKPPATASLVAALKGLHPDALALVLDALGAELRQPLPAPPKATRARLCGVCRLPYPKCRAQWADDHEWESPPARPQNLAGDPT